MTIYDACEFATDQIWDDREQYILAVLRTLHLDPEYEYEKYLDDLKEYLT